MKKIGVILFFIFSFTGVKNSYAQTWDSVGGGVKGESKDHSFVAYGISSLCVYNGNLYAGGNYDTVANTIITHGLSQWNGTSWDTIKMGGEEAAALLVYNGNLVALGYCPSLINVGQYIGQWNGSNWNSLGEGIQTSGQNGADLYALAQYNGDLYATGSFLSPFYRGIAKWNGSSWDSLPEQHSLYGNGQNGIYTMVEYNGKLYAGGRFNSNGISNIAAWNDTAWSAVGAGVSGYGLSGVVVALAVYNGKLYAGGYFDSAGGKPAKSIAVWDGNIWSALGSGVDSGGVYALGVYNNVLVAGGAFDTAGGIACSNIAQWKDTTWSAMGKGIKGSKKEGVGINTLCVYNGYLYVGGQFDSAGGIHVNNIARWGSPPSDTIKNYSGPFMIYPNPSKGIYTVQIPTASGPTTIKIYNVLGQEINSTLLIPTPGADFEINLSNYSAGIYPYRVTAANGSILGQGKLIIQK